LTSEECGIGGEFNEYWVGDLRLFVGACAAGLNVHKTKELSRRRTTTRAVILLLPGFLATMGGREGPAATAHVTDGRTPAAEFSEPLQDIDADGLDDRLEDRLAEQFAPIVYHGERESSFPIDVDRWLERTHLATFDATSWANRTQRIVTGPLRQIQLLEQVARLNGVTLSSSGSRSRGKRLSFFLEDVPKPAGPPSIQPADWVTYVHSYPNDTGGVTLQYWRAYAWDDARFMGLNFGHGGDWEGIVVHLDASLQPARTAYLDHTGIVDWGASVRWEGTHPLVWSEEGGHSSYPDRGHMRSTRFIRQPTWTGSVVTDWDGAPLGTSGGLLNVGEKSRPRNGQVFVQYSGLWGSPGALFLTTGYWGPAFNETDAQCADGRAAYKPYTRRRASWSQCGRIYLRAWCDGMKESPLNRTQECYATDDVS
jgi:hypothetical protein